MEALAAGEAEPERPTGSPRSRTLPGPTPPPQDVAGAAGSPASGSYGTLAVRVQPREGLVLIDGERWNGSDDSIAVQLAPGAHTMEVRKAGFRGYLTEVTVEGGETTRLNIALAPETK